MKLSLRLTVAILLALLSAPYVAAQNATELLNLLPRDFGVTVVVHDFKGDHARWEKSAWWRKLQSSVVGKRFLESPEMQHFERWQLDLKKHFQIDWTTIRDDILSGTIVLSYSPGEKDKPDSERGIIVVRTTKPDTLRRLIDRLNEIQKQSGELKSLTAFEHAGITYHRRVQGKKAHYYANFDAVFAISPNEDSLKDLLDRRGAETTESPWIKRFQQAGANGSLVTLCVNPRKVQPDFGPGVKKTDELPSYWRALDAIFVTMKVEDHAELRISIQAKTDALPAWARGNFNQTLARSELWDRLPERSLLTFAGHTDFSGAIDAIRLLLPATERAKIGDDLQKVVNTVVGLELMKDVVPNLGPDWGACVLPARNADELPRLLLALRVRPGSKKPSVDETLFKSVHLLTGLAVLDHNQKNPGSMITIKSAMRGSVEVKYLEGETLFPRGIQPTCALKDGYLLLATSPDTIDDFRKIGGIAGADNDSPIIRLSSGELARLLDQRRDHVLATLTQQPGNAPGDAKRNLENVISLFQLFDTFTLSQRGADGQTSWMLRLTPAGLK